MKMFSSYDLDDYGTLYAKYLSDMNSEDFIDAIDEIMDYMAGVTDIDKYNLEHIRDEYEVIGTKGNFIIFGGDL